VAINPNTVRVDVLIVERLLKRGSMEALRQACSLSRDELLAGIDVSEVEFERWLVAERIRLRQLAIEAHERYAAGLIARAENLSAIQTALRLVALDPLHEGGHRMLMTLYAKQGQVGAALQQYELCAGILAHELDVEPAPETQQVRRDLVLHRTNFHAIAAQRSPGLNALLDAPERATESRIGQRSKHRAYPAR
jgi:DNA-binding SARP family transcriptional activator